MDLEQAMEKILELTDKNKELENMVTSYEIKVAEQNQKAEQDAETITHLKELNMKYFTKLTMEQEGTLGHREEESQEVTEPTEVKPDLDEWLKTW